MKTKDKQNGDDEAEQIKAGIEETRNQMDDTLDALTERLKPRHLLDDVLEYFHSRGKAGHNDAQKIKQAATYVKEGASDASRKLASQVKQHPMPLLLIGAGIAWMIIENRRSDSDVVEDSNMDYMDDSLESSSSTMDRALPSHYSDEGDESSSGVIGKVKATSADLKRKAAQRTASLRRTASEKTARLRNQASSKYDDGVEAFKRTSHEHPLAVGAGFLALGVLAGMLLPNTRKEDQLVGPARDRLMERSRSLAQEALSRGKQVATAAADAVTSELDAQGLTTEGLKEKGRRVIESVKTAAEEEGITPSAIKGQVKTMATNVKDATVNSAKQQSNEFTQS